MGFSWAQARKNAIRIETADVLAKLSHGHVLTRDRYPKLNVAVSGNGLAIAKARVEKLVTQRLEKFWDKRDFRESKRHGGTIR